MRVGACMSLRGDETLLIGTSHTLSIAVRNNKDRKYHVYATYAAYK